MLGKILLGAAVLAAGSSVAAAKQRFYTLRDVACDMAAHCVFKAGGMPFEGELRTYYPDGKLLSAAEYGNGRPNGRYRAYYGNGKPRLNAVYRDGKENSVTTGFFDNGALQFETTMENGIRNGISRSYYRDGMLRLEETYLNGRQDGTANGYYPDGSPRFRFIYNAGKPVSGYCLTASGTRVDFPARLEAYATAEELPCDTMD